MEIRVLTEADRHKAVELWGAVGLARPWNDPSADFDRALAGPSSVVLGTFDEVDLVGTVMVGHDGHRGWVYYLAVKPAENRQGLGRGLMSAAEAWLRDVGAVKVQLMVRHGNSPALTFYERLGYEEAAVTVLARWLV